MARLVDNRSGSEHRLAADVAAVGRHGDCDIVLPGSTVSRLHAEIRRAGGRFYVRDLGSTFGTYLNDCRLDCSSDGFVPLEPGDRLRLAVSPMWPEGEFELGFAEGAVAGRAASRARSALAPRPRTPSAHIAYSEHAGILVASLNGVFRGPECDAMADRICGKVRPAPRDVVLDLWRVTHMNSYVFGVLVGLAERLDLISCALALAAAAGHVRRLLDLSGLSAMFGRHATVPEAAAELQRRGQAMP